MKKFTKIVSLLLACVMTLTMLTACGGKDKAQVIPTDSKTGVIEIGGEVWHYDLNVDEKAEELVASLRAADIPVTYDSALNEKALVIAKLEAEADAALLKKYPNAYDDDFDYNDPQFQEYYLTLYASLMTELEKAGIDLENTYADIYEEKELESALKEGLKGKTEPMTIGMFQYTESGKTYYYVYLTFSVN